MATYGPGIDQSQHAKSVSQITIKNTNQLKNINNCNNGLELVVHRAFIMSFTWFFIEPRMFCEC